MAATSSTTARRSDSSARVSAAARSNRFCRARCALIRSVASARSKPPTAHRKENCAEPALDRSPSELRWYRLAALLASSGQAAPYS